MSSGNQDEAVAGRKDVGTADAVAAEAPAGNRARRTARPKEGNVGQALRSVYQQTVNEDVPDEMLKLLGKLA